MMDFVCNEIRVDMWVHSPLSWHQEKKSDGKEESARSALLDVAAPYHRTWQLEKCQHADATWIWFWCCHHLQVCHTTANGFPSTRIYMGDYFLSGLYLLTNLAQVTFLGAGWSRQYSSRGHWGTETLSPR